MSEQIVDILAAVLPIHRSFPLPEHGGCGGRVQRYYAHDGPGELGVVVKAFCSACGWVECVNVRVQAVSFDGSRAAPEHP